MENFYVKNNRLIKQLKGVLQTKLMKSYLYLDAPREKLFFLSGSRIKEEEKVTLGAIFSLFHFFWH